MPIIDTRIRFIRLLKKPPNGLGKTVTVEKFSAPADGVIRFFLPEVASETKQR